VILKRPPGDNFTMRLFFHLKKQVRVPHSIIYTWSTVLDPLYPFGVVLLQPETHYRLKLLNMVTENLVIIGVKDHLTSTHFNPWTDDKPTIAEYLNDFFKFYNEKKFILLTSLENLEAYIKQDNLRIVPWGGDITNHQQEYLQIDPCLDKNLSSNTSFLSLNRNLRHHRVFLINLILGLGIENKGLISRHFKKDASLDWIYNTKQLHIQKIIEKGWLRANLYDGFLNESADIYTNNNNDNPSNFKNKLKNFYRETFVEIISETSCTEKCFNITEKTLNSFYGCNFPIFISSKGTVRTLREIGFDMFDDIINHQYDELDNVVDRIFRAITDNLELLSNVERTKNFWISSRERFIKNVDLAKLDMYNYYSDRASYNFGAALNEFRLHN